MKIAVPNVEIAYPLGSRVVYHFSDCKRVGFVTRIDIHARGEFFVAKRVDAPKPYILNNLGWVCKYQVSFEDGSTVCDLSESGLKAWNNYAEAREKDD